MIYLSYKKRTLPEAVQSVISKTINTLLCRSQFEYLLILEQTLLLYDFGRGDVICIMMSLLMSFVLLLCLAPFSQIWREMLKMPNA